jgi:hypothetical protein
MGKIDSRKPFNVVLRTTEQGTGKPTRLRLTLFAHSRAVILNMFREYDVDIWRKDD